MNPSSHDLAKKRCIPCRGDTSPLKKKALKDLLNQLDNDWKVIKEHHLEKEYKFSDFRTALSFTNLVGDAAEKEGHHPDVYLTWGKVKLTIWTHKIDGLTESDFILAAKCEELYRGMDHDKVCF